MHLYLNHLHTKNAIRKTNSAEIPEKKLNISNMYQPILFYFPFSLSAIKKSSTYL